MPHAALVPADEGAPAGAPGGARSAAVQRQVGRALASGASSLLRALKEYGEGASAATAWQVGWVEPETVGMLPQSDSDVLVHCWISKRLCEQWLFD